MDYLAVDTEYERGNPAFSHLAGYSYSWAPGKARYVPLSGLGSGAKLSALQRMMDNTPVLIMHNQAADSTILTAHGLTIPYDRLHDTMGMAALLCKENLGLKSLAYTELGIDATELDELTGTGTKQRSVLDISPEELGPYACADADNTGQLYFRFMEEFKRDPLSFLVYEDIERPLFPVVVDMARTGMVVDIRRLPEIEREVQEKWGEVDARIQELPDLPHKWQRYKRKPDVMLPFNPASPQQVAEYLYRVLKLPPQTGKTGQLTTDEPALFRLLESGHDHPFVWDLLSWRECHKLVNTYIKGIRDGARDDGHGNLRLYYVLKQFAAKTGRTSFEGLLQTIPIRSKMGSKLREVFTAPQGMDFLDADYSQVELRTFTLVSKDPQLQAYYQDLKADFHAWVVEQTSIPRREAKVVTFGRFFGQSEDATYMGVYAAYREDGEQPPTREEFHKFWLLHLKGVPALGKYHLDIEREVRNKGEVRTWFGRRLVVPRDARGTLLRTAYSHPIQGTAADVLKKAMPPVWQYIKNIGGQLVAPVHDELCNYVPQWHAFTGIAKGEVKCLMENVVNWPIPLIAEVKTGPDWASTH